MAKKQQGGNRPSGTAKPKSHHEPARKKSTARADNSVSSDRSFQGFTARYLLHHLQRGYTNKYPDQEHAREEESSAQADILISILRSHGISQESTNSTDYQQIRGYHKFRTENDYVYLETLPGKLGEIPDPSFEPTAGNKHRKIPLVPATPEEYFEHMEMMNDAFAIIWKITNAVKIGNSLTIQTCFRIPSDLVKDFNDHKSFLQIKGFLPVENLESTFYSSEKDYLIILRRLRTSKCSAGAFIPATDFLISRPSMELKKQFGLVSNHLIRDFFPPSSDPVPDQFSLEKAYGHFEGKITKKVKRPELPCSIENALVYLTDNKEITVDTIVNAFKTFLAVYQTSKEQEIEEIRIDQLADSIKEIKTKVFKRCELGFPDSRNLQQELNENENKLKQALEVKNSINKFQLGKNIHPELDWMAKIRWHRYSRSSRSDASVDIPTMLELMTCGFREFWGDNYNAFQTRSQIQLSRESKLSRKRSDVGQKGAPKRDHDKWLKLTSIFCDYLESKNSQMNPINMQEMRTPFLDSHQADTRTIAKQKEFLGTLINLLFNPSDLRDYENAVMMMKDKNIKNLSPDTARECTQIMETRLMKKPARRKPNRH